MGIIYINYNNIAEMVEVCTCLVARGANFTVTEDRYNWKIEITGV